MRSIQTSVSILIRATMVVFASWRYQAIAIASALVFAAISILIPVFLIPANTLAYTLSRMHAIDSIVLALFSVAAGALVAANIFLLRRDHMGTLTTGGIGVIVSLIGGVFATSCGCGIGFIISILGIGLGGASLLATYQTPIMLVSLAVVLIGIFYSARAVVGVCSVVK